MFRSIFAVLLALLLLTNTANRAPAEDMEFHKFGTGGFCSTCNWIVADGEFKKETPEHFLKFISENPDIGFPARNIVVLNSPGGDLISGMALGRIIRQHGFRTVIASTKPVGPPAPEWHHYFTPGACYSACAYAFLGGVERHLWDRRAGLGDPDSVIGFHQFYQDLDLRARMEAVLLDDGKFSDDQLISALIVKYLVDMGVDPSLLQIATNSGADEIAIPTETQLNQYKIITDDGNTLGPWDLEPYNGGLIAFTENRFTLANPLSQLTLYCTAPDRFFLLITSLVLQGMNLGKRFVHSAHGVDISVDGQEYIFKMGAISERINDEFHYATIQVNADFMRSLSKASKISLNFSIATIFRWHFAERQLTTMDREIIKILPRACIQ